MYAHYTPQVSLLRSSATQTVDGDLRVRAPGFRSSDPPLLGANLRAQFIRDNCYLHECYRYVCSSCSGVFCKQHEGWFLYSPPPVTIAACHKAGWIQKESYTQWFKYFVRFVKLSKKDPVILTIYGHYSYSRIIEVIDCAQEKGVHIICLPAHSTLKLKPLELFFRQPLKTYYTQEMKILMKNQTE